MWGVNERSELPGHLLSGFLDPKGQAVVFEYNVLGHLIKNTNAGRGGWKPARIEHAPRYTPTMTTAGERVRSLTNGHGSPANGRFGSATAYSLFGNFLSFER